MPETMWERMARVVDRDSVRLDAKRQNSAQTSPLTAAICIGTYNQAQYLKGSIESAVRQTYPIDEIWVSDDASTDETPEVMEEICKVYPQVRYYRQPVNLRLPGNLSWLLSQPNTDLIVRLDSDDCLEPEYVAVLAELLRKHPRAGFAHCNVYELDQQNKQTKIRRLARTKTFESAEEFLKSNAGGYHTAANCILYRTQALKDVNYYIPNLDWGPVEDWDMVLRMAAKGWGNVFSPQVLSNYRVWEDAQGARAKRKMAEVWTTSLVYEKTLIPEYKRRGWSIAPLKRSMVNKAVGFVDALDSPRFNDRDRDEYKAFLNQLGKSTRLSIAIKLAEIGFNPAMRAWVRLKRRLKEFVKRVVLSGKLAHPRAS